ncbi:MAG: hypothetical protein FWD17_08920 [Polyangiaceae bacterium]|nr:hypothetical protein [Polyangiaceae bacterium]
MVRGARIGFLGLAVIESVFLCACPSGLPAEPDGDAGGTSPAGDSGGDAEDGATDSGADGTLDGGPDAAPDGTLSDGTDDTPDDGADGTTDGGADGTTEGGADAMADSAGDVASADAGGCIKQLQVNYDSAVVQLGDGTVWAFEGMTTPRQFESISVANAGSGVSDLAAGPASENVGCAVVSGSVWCFPYTGTASSPALGSGDASTASGPVQVVMSGGSPLNGVLQISGRSDLGRASFCAVTTGGNVWCWGDGSNGQLGVGDTSSSGVARPVRTSDGAIFSGAQEVRMGWETACALEADGTVWCWGTNGLGELGVLVATSYYPVQIPLSGAASKLSTNYFATPCAIMKDGSVTCWGYNSSETAGAPATSGDTSTAATAGPTTVILADGGAPLSGVLDIANNGENGTCARRAPSLDIVCWGAVHDAQAPYPFPYTDTANNAVTGVSAPLAGGYLNFAYVDSSGRLAVDVSYKSMPQPPCPGENDGGADAAASPTDGAAIDGSTDGASD